MGPVVTCSASEGGLLLIASDGLWDVADFATVARVLCQSLRWVWGGLALGLFPWASRGIRGGQKSCMLKIHGQTRPSVGMPCAPVPASHLCLHHLPTPHSTTPRASGGDLVDGARAVLAHALKHRTKDDVSIVLARVLPEAEWEARSPPRSFSSGPIFGDP